MVLGKGVGREGVGGDVVWGVVVGFSHVSHDWDEETGGSVEGGGEAAEAEKVA